MSGLPQTPNRYTPNRQFIARPGVPQQQQAQTPHMALGTPTQRPGMLGFRPGMTPLQQHQQQMYLAGANRQMPAIANMTPQQQAQYTHQLQQQYLQQQMAGQQARPQPGMAAAGHPQMAGNMRPGVPQQSPFLYANSQSMAVTGVGIQGQQPHPALIQPHTPTQQGRKRKTKTASDGTSAADADDGVGSGDELDQLQPYNISVARYQNNHNLMSDIFIALPTSTIRIPKHYYEGLDKAAVKSNLDSLGASLEECEKEHKETIERIKKDRGEFSDMLKTLVNAKYEDVDQVKKSLESQFGMQFVDNPYTTVQRVPITKIDAAEGATYKQLGQEILSWIVDNSDSKHALVRFSCLYFTRQASQMDDEYSSRLLSELEYQGYIMRRLLDASYFVVAEACRLLGSMFCISPSASAALDPALCVIVERLVNKPFEAQSTARKKAALAATSTLLSVNADKVHEYIFSVFSFGALRPFLYDTDRLIRDQALDVFEIMVRTATRPESIDQSIQALCLPDNHGEPELVEVLVMLRGLAAIVKALGQNTALYGQSPLDILAIAHLALSTLSHIHSIAPDNGLSATIESADSHIQLSTMRTQISNMLDGKQHSPSRIANSIASESMRIVCEYCTCSFNPEVFSMLQTLLDAQAVQKNTRQLHALLDSIIQALRHAKDKSFAHILGLPSLVSNFAIDSSGLKRVFALVLEILNDQSDYDPRLFGQFVRSLAVAIKARLADMEWEARDTTLEFITGAVETLGWTKSRSLLDEGTLLEDIINALYDSEAYVRASSTQALVAVVLNADTEARRRVVDTKAISNELLGLLLDDSEAFVKRSALELLCAFAQLSTGADTSGSSGGWLHVLTYSKLHQLADDPDFEVRVRCAKLLSLLASWLYISPSAGDAPGRECIKELRVDTLLIDMCRDTSSLAQMRDALKPASNSDDGDSGTAGSSKRRAFGDTGIETSAFYQKLSKIDFRRLEASLTTEHLYQEALDTQVESELMKETRDPNLGNNILDCY
ncbi:hypothetical protein GGI12_003355 [Dipsacomyces acuminosporus]|nr:hypothetical protein GGI12_003355 [Dipsacomyces acuminosporus]